MCKFEILKQIHHGKCNDVFISQDSTGKKYVLKRFYRAELENRKEYRNHGGRLVRRLWLDDFTNSLRIQRLVDHECCIKCHSVLGIDSSKDPPVLEDKIDLVLDFAEYGCLMELETFELPIAEFPKDVIRCIAKDVFLALDYLCTINVAHRDVKPSNIFICSDGRCKLGDFSESDFMTKEGKVIGSKGSYYYLAPEVFQLEHEKDGSAIDVWALGITLWILYFRTFPFTPNKSMLELIEEIQQFNFKKEIEKIKENNGDKSEEFDEVFVDLLGKILEIDPKIRIKPKKALEHPWLLDVDYEVARLYCLNHRKSFL